MDRWAWGDVFSFEVASGWRLTEDEELIELQPEEDGAAAHISVLRRTAAGELAEGDMAQLARDFVDQRGGRLRADPEEGEEGGQRVARGAFETSDEEYGDLVWDIEARGWTTHALLCTCTHDGAHPELRDQALAMFASVRPEGG